AAATHESGPPDGPEARSGSALRGLLGLAPGGIVGGTDGGQERGGLVPRVVVVARLRVREERVILGVPRGSRGRRRRRRVSSPPAVVGGGAGRWGRGRRRRAGGGGPPAAGAPCGPRRSPARRSRPGSACR